MTRDAINLASVLNGRPTFRPFGVIKLSDSSVAVRGGLHVRYIDNDSTYLYPLHVDDDAESMSFRDIKTLTGIAADDAYVVLTWTAEGGLVAGVETDPADTNGDTMPIARLTFEGSAMIVRQLHTGVWFAMRMADGKSCDYTDAGEVQAAGYDTATETAVSYDPDDSLIPYRPTEWTGAEASVPTMLWVKLLTTLKSVSSEEWVTVENLESVVVEWINENYPRHDELADHGGFGDEHVDGTRKGSGSDTSVPYLRLSAGGEPGRNKFDAGVVLTDAAGDTVFDPNLRKLYRASDMFPDPPRLKIELPLTANEMRLYGAWHMLADADSPNAPAALDIGGSDTDTGSLNVRGEAAAESLAVSGAAVVDSLEVDGAAQIVVDGVTYAPQVVNVEVETGGAVEIRRIRILAEVL